MLLNDVLIIKYHPAPPNLKSESKRPCSQTTCFTFYRDSGTERKFLQTGLFCPQ
jgi:hypothetical protein